MTSAPSYFVLAVSTVLAYLIGGLPFGYWFVRLSQGKDIRTMGSGNIGATNVHRSVGGKAGIIVLLLDILKGFIAVWLAGILNHGDAPALALSAVAVMLGHCYPILLHFKGGKAVACFIGAFLYIAPLAIAVTAVAFIAIVALSRYISLASMIGVLIFPLIVWLLDRAHPSYPILVAAIVGALLIVYRHKGNISRLVNGKEPTFSLKGRTA